MGGFLHVWYYTAMTLQDRVLESQNKYDNLQAQRDQYLKAAEECLVEMTKLQGEYRVINELLEEQEAKKVNRKADTIDVVPEKVEK